MKFDLIKSRGVKPAINWSAALAFGFIVACIANAGAIAFYLVLTGAFPPASVLLLPTFFAAPLVVGGAIRAVFQNARGRSASPDEPKLTGA